VLALLLAARPRSIAAQAQIELSLRALLEEIAAIRELAVIYSQGALAHRKGHIPLSRMSRTQCKLADAMSVAAAPKSAIHIPLRDLSPHNASLVPCPNKT